MSKYYTCTSCGWQSVFGAGEQLLKYCPECNSKSCKVLYNSKEVKGEFCNWSGMMKDNERYSRALGVLDEQLPEARKLHPGVEWKKFGNSWRPLIRNRAEKLKILKQAKMEEILNF